MKLHVLLKDTLSLETGHARLPGSLPGAPLRWRAPNMLPPPRAGQVSQALQAWSCRDHPGALHSSPHHPLMGSCSPSKREGCAMVLLLWLKLLSISQAPDQEQCQMAGWPHTWQGVESCCLSSMSSRTEDAQVLCLKLRPSLDAAEQCQDWDCSMPLALEGSFLATHNTRLSGRLKDRQSISALPISSSLTQPPCFERLPLPLPLPVMAPVLPISTTWCSLGVWPQPPAVTLETSQQSSC